MYQVQVQNEAGEWKPYGEATVSYRQAHGQERRLAEMATTGVRIVCVDSAVSE